MVLKLGRIFESRDKIKSSQCSSYDREKNMSFSENFQFFLRENLIQPVQISASTREN